MSTITSQQKKPASTSREATGNIPPSSSGGVKSMTPGDQSSEQSAMPDGTPTSTPYSQRRLTPGERERAELLAAVALPALAELRNMELIRMTISQSDIIIRFPLIHWTKKLELVNDDE